MDMGLAPIQPGRRLQVMIYIIEQKQEPCENLMFATDSTFFSWDLKSRLDARKARKCKVESFQKSQQLQPPGPGRVSDVNEKSF